MLTPETFCIKGTKDSYVIANQNEMKTPKTMALFGPMGADNSAGLVLSANIRSSSIQYSGFNVYSPKSYQKMLLRPEYKETQRKHKLCSLDYRFFA